VASQDRSDARLRHCDTEFLELTDDPKISPPGVFLCQPADQPHCLVGKGRTSWSAMRVGPALLDQRAVPIEDRLGRDEERSPALTRHKTGQESDECTIGPGESWTDDLAAEYGQLMAEYQDLSVLSRGIQPVDTNGLEDAPDETVEEGQGHGG
jgi:hypothetical protein